MDRYAAQNGARMSMTAKVDCLSDYERRELDYWIARNIEQLDVRHGTTGPPNAVEVGSMCRLPDKAWKEFIRLHPNFKPSCTGPYPVSYYSFNPAIALNTFQGTEYSEGWTFTRQNEKWCGINDGLSLPETKSLALSLMLALEHEYKYQNKKE